MNTPRLKRIKQLLIRVRNGEFITPLVFKIEKLINLAVLRERRRLLREIKTHFELMVFDDTGEDKLINLMNFRRDQSKYLKSLIKGGDK